MKDKFDYAVEERNLAYMWDRHPEEFLSAYLRSGFFNPFINPQQILTRNFLASRIFGAELNHPYPILAILKLFFGFRDFTPMYLSSAIGKLTEKTASKIIEAIEARFYRNQANSQKVSVVDVGCGSGNYYEGFLKSGLAKHISYIGIDVSKKNIANATRRFSPAHFRVGNIFSIDFPDNSFDLVIVSHVFEHLHPRALACAIRESIRVSKAELIFNFFREQDVPKHVINPVDKYHWNFLARRELLKIIGSHAVTIIDRYPSLGSKKIQFIDRRGALQSYSSWIIKKYES